MNRFLLLLIAFLVLPFLAFSGGSNAYALGHYGISGTVEGCNDCHDFASGYYDSPGSGNLRWVKSTINSRSVDFTSFDSPPGTLADGDDDLLDGPCEVCHTTTKYHTNSGDGEGETHFDGEDCTFCHPHFVDDITNYFEPRFVGTQSHTTHFTDAKGPLLGSDPDCTVCHYPGSFSKFGDTSPGDDLDVTDVCDACHSPDGAAEGKEKWADSVYESNGYELKAGNENWCATCHDDAAPVDDATAVVAGVTAPNVMGDETTWGYNISGHGKFTVGCEDCHDLAVSHTDGDARTYSLISDNYVAAYRLDDDMTIPRVSGSTSWNSFSLCFENCHVFSNIFGAYTTNFRRSGLQLHSMHLNSTTGVQCWDSDWDGNMANEKGLSCPACHNVHGSPTPVMTRHGELISTPGTIDKVPALDFRWYEQNGTTQTTLLAKSRYGALQAGGPSLSGNNVCIWCHAASPEEIQYYRTPVSGPGVNVDSLWTTDLNNIVKNSFSVGDGIRYHVSFQISGPDFYFIQSPGTIVGSRAYNTSGADWYKRLKKTGILSAGGYEWTWDRRIPSVATPGSGARAKVLIKIFDFKGGNLIQKQSKFHTFSVAP